MGDAGFPVIDHVFLCTSRGAPDAELLVKAGLTEGTSNRHMGQGTACRRFFFTNAMLELLWLADETELNAPQARRTRLAERFAGGAAVSPFGVILRPAAGTAPVYPFPSWNYRPPEMPGLDLEIAERTGLEEPMWCYLKSGEPPAAWPEERRQALQHPAGLEELTKVQIAWPKLQPDTVTHQMAKRGIIGLHAGEPHLLELQFDHGRRGSCLDFRPRLPLVLRA